MNGDDPLRSVLPLLRPRSAEPTLFSQTVWYLLWIGVAVLLGLYVRRHLRLRRQRRDEFYAAGRDACLTDKQIDLLFAIARKQRMRSPVRLLHSAHVFDRHVGAAAAKLARQDRGHPRLATLGRIRASLEFDDLPVDQTLRSTRQIDRGQTLMVDSGDGEDGYAPGLVLARDDGVLTLAPMLREGAAAEAAHAHRPGDELRVRFWREGDTEYSFDTHVIGPGPGSGGALDVEHARLQRLQQRDFYRIDVGFPIDFRLLTGGENDPGAADAAAAVDLLLEEVLTDADPAAQDDDGTAAALETAPSLEGQVVNLSAGGLAVEIDPAAPEGAMEAVWVVDPAFVGPFPMAGLRCTPVGTEPGDAGRRIKLRFESLPAPVEKAIVRAVYEHQLQSAAGRDPEAPGPLPAPSHGEAEDDGLPQPPD